VSNVNCGQCKHFVPSIYKNWGDCAAPFPAWIEFNAGSESMVWVIDGHPNNYADRCVLFDSSGSESGRNL